MYPESLEELNLNYKELGSSLQNLDQKEKWWIPLCFSAFVMLVFWLTFISAVGDCLRIRRQQDLIFIEQENLYRKMYSIRTGQMKNDCDPHRLVKPFKMVQNRLYVFVRAVFSSLLCVCIICLGHHSL